MGVWCNNYWPDNLSLGQHIFLNNRCSDVTIGFVGAQQSVAKLPDCNNRRFSYNFLKLTILTMKWKIC